MRRVCVDEHSVLLFTRVSGGSHGEKGGQVRQTRVADKELSLAKALLHPTLNAGSTPIAVAFFTTAPSYLCLHHGPQGQARVTNNSWCVVGWWPSRVRLIRRTSRGPAYDPSALRWASRAGSRKPPDLVVVLPPPSSCKLAALAGTKLFTS